jgi:hypothetical protein
MVAWLSGMASLRLRVVAPGLQDVGYPASEVDTKTDRCFVCGPRPSFAEIHRGDVGESLGLPAVSRRRLVIANSFEVPRSA